MKVTGVVQGVSYRAAMLERAGRHGVEGWVRNSSDGSVEALIQGDEEAVNAIVEWSRVGPPRARVTSVLEQRKERHPRLVGFRIDD